MTAANASSAKDTSAGGDSANDDQVLAAAVAVLQAVSSRRKEADSAMEEAMRDCKRMRTQATEEATRTGAKAKEEATQMGAKARDEAKVIMREAREERAALEEEKAAMKKALEEEKAAMEEAHTFQKSRVPLSVGGHRFETSLQTLTAIPDTYLSSLFSGRFDLSPDAEGVYFIDRDGTHFRHVLNFLRDSGSFTLGTGPAMPGPARAELVIELQFYGLLDRMMPHYAQEQIGVSLLRRACISGTKQALQAAVAQARALVVQMGSTTPWLSEEFQDARYLITERMVSDVPVWAAENGKYFLYVDKIGDFSISGDAPAGGIDFSDEEIKIWHMTAADMEGEWAPNMLSPTKWRSDDAATLEVQYVAAQIENPENPFVAVPNMRVTAVHGLPDDDPAMAAALRQLADMNYERPRKRARSQSQE